MRTNQWVVPLLVFAGNALAGFQYVPPPPATSAPTSVVTSSVCSPGVVVIEDAAAPVLIPEGHSAGSWLQFGVSIGPGWTVSGTAAGATMRWRHGTEPLVDVLDRLGKLNGFCIWAWLDSRVIEVASAPAEAAQLDVSDPEPMPSATVDPVPVTGAVVEASPEPSVTQTSVDDVPALQPSLDPAADSVGVIDTAQVPAAEDVEAVIEMVEPAEPPPWQLESGEALRDALQRWAQRDGGSLVWEPDFDLRIEVATAFPGDLDFQEVVERVLRSYWRAGEKLRGRYFATNRVLLVTAEE